MSKGNPTSINRSFASSSEDPGIQEDLGSEPSSCFSRFKKKKSDINSPLIGSSKNQLNSYPNCSSLSGPNPSLQSNPVPQDPRKSYKELRRLSRITYTKLHNEQVLKEFRQTGENKLTSEKIHKFLDDLEPIESKPGSSLKGGVMLESDGKLFIYAVDFQGECRKLIVKEDSKVEVAKVEGNGKVTDDSVIEKFLKPSKSEKFNVLTEIDDHLVEDAVFDGRDLHMVYCCSEGIFHRVFNLDEGKTQKKQEKLTFNCLNKGKSFMEITQVAFSSKKTFLLGLKDGLKSKNKIIEILKFEDLEKEKNVFVDLRTSAFGYLEEKELLVVGTQDGVIYFHDTRIGERSFHLNAHSYNISKLFLLEDRVITFSGDKTIKVTKFPEQLFRLDVSDKKFQSIIATPSTIIGVQELKNEEFKSIEICEIFENNENLETSIKSKIKSDLLVKYRERNSQEGTSGGLIKSIHLALSDKYLEIASSNSISFYSNSDPNYSFDINYENLIENISQEKESIKIHYQSSIFSPDYPDSNIVICSYKDEDNYKLKENVQYTENIKFKFIKYKEDITKFIYHIVENPNNLESKSATVVCIFGIESGDMHSFSFGLPDLGPSLETIDEFKKFDKKHSLKITAICHYLDKIWTASQDRTIKIWKSSNDLRNDISHRLIYSFGLTNGVAQFLAPIQDDYMLSCTMIGNVNCFSATTFTKIFSIKLYGPIKCFTVKGNYIFYCNLKSIIKYELAINEKKENSDDVHEITIVGPDEGNYYQACNYLKDLLNYKNPEFNSAYDQWVILPYLISPLHFYAQFNMPSYVSKSLYYGVNLNESTENQSALSIAVSKDYEECVTLIMKSLKYKVIDNPYFIDFFGNTQLIEMNFNSRKSLTLFYRLLLTKITGTNQPRFTHNDVTLPIWKSFEDIVMDYKTEFPELYPPNQSNQPNLSLPSQSGQSRPVANPPPQPPNSSIQDKMTHENTIGKPIIFMRSLFKLSQERGEKRSIDLLRSFIECGNNDIYRTQFVQTYIELKFLKAKPYMIFEVSLYLFYLMLLCIYIEADNINLTFVIVPILVGAILSFIEILRLIAFGSIYLKDGWNICNFIRSLLFYAFLGYTVQGDVEGKSIKDREGVNYPLILLVFLSFIRGILMFRLFDGTRYFLHLLQIVVASSFSFMMVLIYVLIVISLVLLQASLYSDTIQFFLGEAFLIVTGGLSPEDEGFSIAEWVVFLIAVVLLTWIMMNLLVAIYNDSFATVYNYKDIYKYKTKAWMAYEIELVLLLLYRIKLKIIKTTKLIDRNSQNNESGERELTKRVSKRSYLYVCDEGGWKEESDQVAHKISKSKLKAKQTIKQLDIITEHVTRISDINKKIQKEKAANEQGAGNEDEETRTKNLYTLFDILIKDISPTGEYGDEKVEKVGKLLESLDI